jgi:hypothetical protein
VIIGLIYCPDREAVCIFKIANVNTGDSVANGAEVKSHLPMHGSLRNASPAASTEAYCEDARDSHGIRVIEVHKCL